MRGGPVFLGVYAKAAELEQHGEKNATRWHVWGLADGGFMLQEAPLDQSAAPGAPGGKSAARRDEPRRLSPDEFFLEYRVLAAFSPHKKSRQPGPAAPPGAPGAPPPVEDYTQNARSGPAPAAPAAPEGGPRPDSEARKPGAYSNVWARQGEPAGAPFKPSGAAGARAWLPPAAGGEDGQASQAEITIVKGRREAARPLLWDLPGQAEDEASSPRQAQVLESLEETGGPVEMSRAEIERIEEDFRTEFSLALIRLKAKRDEGIAALEKMVEQPGPFAEEHKFMFTDCGLALRKRNFYALANKYHERARQLSPEDEHVLFNQARVMYESGRIDKARSYLQLALEMAPDFAAAGDFLAFIDGPNKR